MKAVVLAEPELVAQALAAGLRSAGLTVVVCDQEVALSHDGPVLLRCPAGASQVSLGGLPRDRTVVLAGSRRVARLAADEAPAAIVPADADLASLVMVVTAVAEGHDPPLPSWHPIGRPPLTEREVTALEHVARGDDDAAIATAMGIARRTAGTHVQRALDKLGVTSRVAAVVVLREAGVLDERR